MGKSVLLVVLLLFLSLLRLAWPFISFYFTPVADKQQLAGRDFIIVGHRGAAGHAPENTMASFEKAIELGADWVELDVHVSKDGQLMVMHDARVDRTTDGTGAISGLTFNEIRTLDAGSWFDPAFAGEKVPSLAEVIREINGRTTLLIELKWPEKGLYEGLGTAVADEIHKYGAESWCIIQSFETKYLTEAASRGYNIPLQKLLIARSSFLFMPIYQDNRFHMGKLPLGGQVTSVNYFYKGLTSQMIEWHHANNQQVIPFTVNDELTMKKVLGMGVDGVITDYPDVAKQLRDTLKQGL